MFDEPVRRQTPGRAVPTAITTLMLCAAFTAAGGDEAPGPCTVTCPPGAVIEDESCLFGDPDPVDSTNGGCTTDPPVFQDIVCGQTFCGQMYFDGQHRDTDWYRFDNCAAGSIVGFTMIGMAEAGAIYGRVENEDGALDCADVTSLAESVTVGPCEPVFLGTTDSYDGTEFWFFVASDQSQVVDCNGDGADYVFTLQCAVLDPCWAFFCDRTCDEVWDFDELNEVLSRWGPCCAPSCPDFDGDNVVGFGDLLIVLTNWGPCA